MKIVQELPKEEMKKLNKMLAREAKASKKRYNKQQKSIGAFLLKKILGRGYLHLTRKLLLS